MSTPTAPETGFRPFAAEGAPSTLRADVPTVARWIGGVGGLGGIFLGAAVIFFNMISNTPRIFGPTAAMYFIIFGSTCLLYHAARDADQQFRRLYGRLGFLLVLMGLVGSVLPAQGGVGGLFLPWGFLCLVLGLVFLLAFSRHEDDAAWRQALVAVLSGVGSIAALAGMVGGSISTNFLIPYGLVLALVGLFYLWSAVGLLSTTGDLGHRLGMAIGALGAIVALIALTRCFLPGTRYLVPSGLLLMGLGTLYMLLSIGICSERRLVVLTRRELAAYFYSPIAYLVLFGTTMVGLLMYWMFIGTLLDDLTSGARPEPIVREYIISLIPVMCVIFVVPVLTMRLLSEERRTGTYEVLLTAPLDEITVVLSKFFAALTYYLLLWVPWGLFLVELRVDGGKPFDVLPLISFYGALLCSGAAFVSMGLFFSSLTRNQIISASFTFMGMMVLLAFYFLGQSRSIGPTWTALFKQFSFIDLWITSLSGKLYVRDIVLQLSMALFWLYVTVKVLETRKWS